MVLLHNLYTVSESAEKETIVVDRGLIQDIYKHDPSPRDLRTEISLSFEDSMVYPGLINSHEHLEFNLFPALGEGIYNNYIEWGTDIQKRESALINKVLAVPLELRVQWGIYKNILNGVTTIVNHGMPLTINSDEATVIQKCLSLHSVRFEKGWLRKLNNPFMGDKPVVIHIGEGTDDTAKKEIDEFIRWNLLNKKIIGVHGVAMTSNQASAFDGLIWCPASNYFLFGKTAEVDKLAQNTRIVFGTDSTLTADWNLWQHLRLARNEEKVSDECLVNMLTSTPAVLWGLRNSGKIAAGYNADLVVAKMKVKSDTMESFFKGNPEDILLVMHNGEILIFDEDLSDQIKANDVYYPHYSKIYMNNCAKYVKGDLPALMDKIRKYYPEAIFPICR